MNPQEIMEGMKNKNRALTIKNDEYKTLVADHAEAKKEFNIALASKFLELKTAGQKTTLIPKLAAGDKTVADLQYKLDVSEGVMNACRESIKDIREAIGSYRSILTWLRAELVSSE